MTKTQKWCNGLPGKIVIPETPIMTKAAFLIGIFVFISSCKKISTPDQVNNPISMEAISFLWKYNYVSRCPYNPFSLAPCIEYSKQDTAIWVHDSSYMLIDQEGFFYQRILGKNGYWSVIDTFKVVQTSDSILHIVQSGSGPGTSIRIITLQDHLLILGYFDDLYGNSFGLDSLSR